MGGGWRGWMEGGERGDGRKGDRRRGGRRMDRRRGRKGGWYSIWVSLR